MTTLLCRACFEAWRPARQSPTPSRKREAPEVAMSVLRGANVANEVAKGDFAEATIGCPDDAEGVKWCKLFNTPDFAVSHVPDVSRPPPPTLTCCPQDKPHSYYGSTACCSVQPASDNVCRADGSVNYGSFAWCDGTTDPNAVKSTQCIAYDSHICSGGSWTNTGF